MNCMKNISVVVYTESELKRNSETSTQYDFMTKEQINKHDIKKNSITVRIRKMNSKFQQSQVKALKKSQGKVRQTIKQCCQFG